MPNLFESQTGYATISTAPNFLGMLYESNVRKTQFLSAIAGVGGERTMIAKNPEFPTGVEYSLNPPEQPSISENLALSNLPPETYPLSQHTNVIQIFQLIAGVSRLRERSNRLEGINTAGEEPERTSEIAQQIEFAIRDIARQMNYTAINGVFSDAGLTNPDSALQTRGILEAITTNVIDGTGISSDEEIQEIVDELFRKVFDSGMFSKPTLVLNSLNKVKITKAYASRGLIDVPSNRFTAGINVQSIVTNFANDGVYVIIDNDMPDDVILLSDMDYIRPVFTQDKKGGSTILVHPLSQRGGDMYEIYAEFGLDHGPESYHGKIINFLFTS